MGASSTPTASFWEPTSARSFLFAHRRRHGRSPMAAWHKASRDLERQDPEADLEEAEVVAVAVAELPGLSDLQGLQDLLALLALRDPEGSAVSA